VLAPKFGTEPRLGAGPHDNANPGPQYTVERKPEFINEPKYTFGFRRGSHGLKNVTSTPGAIGPGRYVPEAAANPSNRLDFPRYSLPKQPRPEMAVQKYDKH
jgi:hypothetical protein